MFLHTSLEDKKIVALKEKIPYEFKDEKHLQNAVAESTTPHNVYHLETIGDCLINTVVKTSLGIANPNWTSGQITQASQSFLRNLYGEAGEESILCLIAKNIGLKEYFLGYRSLYGGKYGPAYTYASAVEALVGAVFYDCDHDFETVRTFILKIYEPFNLIEDKIPSYSP